MTGSPPQSNPAPQPQPQPQRLPADTAKLQRAAFESYGVLDAATGGSFDAVFDRAGIGMLVFEPDGRIVRANPAFAAMLGREVDDLRTERFSTVTSAEDLPRELELLCQLLAGETSNIVREKRYRHADGSLVTALTSTTVIRDPAGTATGLLSHVESIEDRRRAEESLLETQSATDAIITSDAQGSIIAWNEGAQRLFGHSRSEALGRPVALIMPAESRQAHAAGLARVAGGGRSHLLGRTVELTGQRRDGSQFPVELSLSGWEYRGRARFTAVVRDVTERQRLHQEMTRQANTDGLTSVGNRSWLVAELEAALAAVPAAPLSVLVLELQGLRAVDEGLGLLPGDRILVDAAELLRDTLRRGDRLARVDSGDFAVMLPDTTPAKAAVVAARLRAAIPAEFVVSGAPVAISVCIGVAHHRGPVGERRAAESASLLLRNASLALSAARTAPDRVATYTSAMSERARRRLSLHGALQDAIGRGELSLAYQPQLHLASGRLRGVEALVRWTSPTLGSVDPTEFVPIAEDSGLAVELGTWVLRRACDQAARWAHERDYPIGVSVNVSGHQLMSPTVTATLSDVLQDTGLDPRLLTLEITESVLMEDPDVAAEHLAEIRSLGVKTAVDDFGTGYSGLASLTRFPLDELKIDQSFIAALPGDPATAHVTRAIIDLARGLQLRTVGEGIETAWQCQALATFGCDLGQGYLFARPMSADAVTSWQPSDTMGRHAFAGLSSSV